MRETYPGVRQAVVHRGCGLGLRFVFFGTDCGWSGRCYQFLLDVFLFARTRDGKCWPFLVHRHIAIFILFLLLIIIIIGIFLILILVVFVIRSLYPRQ